MKVTRDKNCFCLTCNKNLHNLGVARHRAMHRDKKETCRIKYSSGETFKYSYGDQKI